MMLSGNPTKTKTIIFYHRTPFTIIKDVMRTDGFLGFYRGISSTVLREVPGYFFFFGGYEVTKYWLTKGDENKENIGKQILISVCCLCYNFRFNLGSFCFPSA